MDNQTLTWLVLIGLVLVIILSRRRASKYIPKKSRDLAWAKFVQEFHSNPANRGKHPRKKDYEFDHIYPRSKGGTSRPDNVQVLSRKKNRSKGAKMPWE